MTDSSTESISSLTTQHGRGPRKLAELAVTVAAALGAAAVFFHLGPFVVNVVTYQVEPLRAPLWPQSLVIPAAAVAAVTWAARRMFAPAGKTKDGRVAGADVTGGDAAPGGVAVGDEPAPARRRVFDVALLLIPAAAAVFWRARGAPDFVSICAAFVAIAWAVTRCGRRGGAVEPRWAIRGLVPIILTLAIAASTLWHAGQQHRFWQHFMLGYADFGFFTTELEHCLPWKAVGPWRFYDTRLGYHAVFMFYALVPLYMVFRSPLFLMIIGPLALNLAAVPFYQLARRRCGSPMAGLVVALAWLALPSVSRLPYSNTYGFQSIYLAVPWLAFMFSFAFQGRWRWSHVCLAGALLCEETVCGVALGWGVYLLVSGKRRRDGVIIAAAAVAYLLLCTTVIIPHFDRAGRYTRLHLFGDLLEGSPLQVVSLMFQRLARGRVPLYLLALAAAMLPSLLRRWPLMIAALPTLMLVLLMQQTDYLNLKYWHHASVLVVLFAAAVLGVTPGRNEGFTSGAEARGQSRRPSAGLGPPLGLLIGALLFHYAMGTSPLAQSQRVYHGGLALTGRDPRLDIVAGVRARFDKSRYAVIATERMAAHFIDYRMVIPAPAADLAADSTPPALLVFDSSDGWDKINMESETAAYLAQAQAAGFVPVIEDGPVMVLVKNGSGP